MEALVSTDESPGDPEDAAPDPIAAQRSRIARRVGLAKRIGYLGLLVAILGFVVSAAAGFPGWAVAVTIAGLVVGIVVLPLPIILGYGIMAAEREERGGGRFH
jgi:ABC-type tungstate transport system substrate-binding protein